FPASVFDAIFAATVPHTGVAPVMFSNKFGMRTGGNRLRFTGCAHLEKFPLLSASPAILDAQFSIDVLYIVLHRESEVALSIKCPGNEGNHTTRHKLADENDTASPGVSRFSSHVEAQIYFLEIAIPRDRKTQKTCIEIQKSDGGDECLAVLIIDLRSDRNERFNQSRIDDVIQHRQITPVSSEKGLHVEVRRSQTDAAQSIVNGAHSIADRHSLRLGNRTEIGLLRGENPVRPGFIILPWRRWNSQCNKLRRDWFVAD